MQKCDYYYKKLKCEEYESFSYNNHALLLHVNSTFNTDLLIQVHVYTNVDLYLIQQIMIAGINNLDKRLFLSRIIIQDAIFIIPEQFLDCSPGIATRFRSRDHVERNRQSAAFINIVHPEASAGKFPFHITVSLSHTRYIIRTSIAII